MKPIIQKFGVFIAVLCASLSASAYDFMSDDLFYTILSKEDRTVAVVGNYHVSGDLEIPRKVIYKSKTYTVTRIENYAFYECSSLTSITIPNSVTSIEKCAFYQCSGLTSVTIPESVTSIEGSAFSNCSSLTSVTIPNSVTSIGENAFGRCKGLASVTIGNSVTSIGSGAFIYCSNLTSVTIGNSVTSIGERVFYDCNGIKDIYMQCEVPIECSPGFSDYILKTTVLYVPTATLTEYEKVDPWRNFWNIEEMAFSGVDGIEADYNGSINVSVNNGSLTIDGIDNSESVTVYDMQGCMVFHGTSPIIENLPSGLYIVVARRRTVKVMI